MENDKGCDGCREEMIECYSWQQKGFNSGLAWFEGHCYVFVLDQNDDFIIKYCHMQIPSESR